MRSLNSESYQRYDVKLYHQRKQLTKCMRIYDERKTGKLFDACSSDIRTYLPLKCPWTNFTCEWFEASVFTTVGDEVRRLAEGFSALATDVRFFTFNQTSLISHLSYNIRLTWITMYNGIIPGQHRQIDQEVYQ